MPRVPTNWYVEFVTPEAVQQFAIKGVVYQGRSQFQSIEVIDTYTFGRCLVLDGKIQSSEKDEFIYHEALVHPALILHPGPRKVFVAGGGEGATLREILAHRSVERVVMVDLDPQVIEVTRKHLQAWHQGAFDDPRVELLHQDAREYLAQTDERFDAMVLDLVEPLEEGPAYLLYTREFYALAAQRLDAAGVLCLQACATTPEIIVAFLAINNTLKTAFPTVRPYQVHVPSFGGPWGFAVASTQLDPLDLSAEEVDRRIAQRLAAPLRFYDGTTHRGLFALPRHLRAELARDKRVITDDQPLCI